MANILYLVHDLTDPAVARRVAMLEAGGASVVLAGFTRGTPPERVGRTRPMSLGTTADGRFAQRIAMVGKAVLTARAALAGTARPDVIIGRNLEMLAVAQRVAALQPTRPPVVYECLDIHRLMLGTSMVGRAMRLAERRLAGRAALLMTSSPRFLEAYFEPRRQAHIPTLLVENKVLELGPAPHRAKTADLVPGPGAPWRIGWFGALRCARSFDILSAFTRACEGRYEVLLRGRPARDVFPDFEARIAKEPFMRFEGAYRNPEDLAGLYGSVQFTWAIDFFEAGMNSDWLLPNRLYEGCRHGAVPIAMAGTQTSRTLAQMGLGIHLDATEPARLAQALPADAAAYAALRDAVMAQPAARFACGPDECTALVRRLTGLAATGRAPLLAEAA